MAPTVTALFIGGPIDGERREVQLSPELYVYESPAELEGALFLPQEATKPSRELLPYIRTYKRISKTPGGVTIYEAQPLLIKYRYTVELDAYPSADLALLLRILSDAVRGVTRHPSAFPGGVVGSRIFKID